VSLAVAPAEISTKSVTLLVDGGSGLPLPVRHVLPRHDVPGSWLTGKLTLGTIDSETLEPITEHTDLTILTVPHPARVTAAAMPGQPPLPWTSRLDFDLKTRNESTAIVIETDIRPRTLTFTLARNESILAVICRDTFRQWLYDPSQDLRTDQLIWSRNTWGVCLSIDDATYRLSPATNSQLKAVV
jgi:hypothetical protein